MLHLTEETFETEVMESELPVVVDFWATWCGPCRMFGPIFEDFAQKAQGKVKAAKVDIDAQPALAQRYGITVVPTVMVFRGGEPAETSAGVMDLAELARLAGVTL